MVIRWDSESDWKNSQDSSGTVGRNGNLRQGYSRERPDLSSGLVGYWPLHDENATDYSGNGNHGSLNNGVTTGVAGRGGLQAMSFDGNDDYINSNTNFSSIIGDGSHTISAWVRTRQTPNNDYVYGERGSDTWTEWWYDGGRVFKVRTASNDTILSTNSWPDPSSQWVHIIHTVDRQSDTSKLFMNAIEKDSNTSTRSLGTTSDTLKIGQTKTGFSGGWWPGSVVDFRIYDRALSSSEVETLYRWGSGDFARPLNNENSSSAVSRWAFDGDATDSWGTNDGTVNGASFVDDAIRAQSADFGSDDIIESSNFSGASFPITISYWVKFRSNLDTNPGRPVYFEDDGGGVWVHQTNTPDATVNYYDGSSNQQLNPPTKSEWVHYTTVINSSQMQVFLNGVLEDERSISLSSSDPSVNYFSMGDDSNGDNGYGGLIDDVRIYSKELSKSEIFDLYRYGTRGRDLRKQLVNF